ncbi:MAG TPA: histidine kinase dimerization/phospho-acceptor domain-containing protein [Planctomycetota bacterium]|nr:histidine kinase dimerization/phospho-acceptor domain-containing protein [Planctomycetota bacterium]
MNPMTAVVFSPVSCPAAAALFAALTAGLGAVRRVASCEEAARACAAEARAILVLDLREADEAGQREAHALRRALPATRMLALLSPGQAAPAECDGVLMEPFYLVEVVRWCARASVAPVAEGVLADLAAGLSHEIGNPLTALLLQLEMLKTDERIPGIRKHLELIEESSRRIQEVVHDVTFGSERRPIATTTGSLRTLLESARTLLGERGAGLAGLVALDCTDQPLAVERDLIASALADLWQYLLLAGDGRRPLHVEAGPLDVSSLGIRARAHVPRLPGDAAGRLFTPLWARQALGLPVGLSLTSARAAFRRHGGDLRAREQRGELLTVEALLPRAGAEPQWIAE